MLTPTIPSFLISLLFMREPAFGPRHDCRGSRVPVGSPGSAFRGKRLVHNPACTWSRLTRAAQHRETSFYRQIIGFKTQDKQARCRRLTARYDRMYW
ncbi:hypothetical protein F5Y19DRAFT_448515 [Xylariaceae sp. FL1651]|nr:hypothetical protein F5Y19DRAFT_448515 [Xylariaceae sp. FL1651]